MGAGMGMDVGMGMGVGTDMGMRVPFSSAVGDRAARVEVGLGV